MSANKYEITKGIRNGAIGGLVAGLVMAVPMLAMNSLNLQVLIPTTLVIGAIYGILTSNKGIRPANTKEGVALGIVTGLISFAILAKPTLVPNMELLVSSLQYVVFGVILGWMTSFLTNREEQRKIGVKA